MSASICQALAHHHRRYADERRAALDCVFAVSVPVRTVVHAGRSTVASCATINTPLPLAQQAVNSMTSNTKGR